MVWQGTVSKPGRWLWDVCDSPATHQMAVTVTLAFCCCCLLSVSVCLTCLSSCLISWINTFSLLQEYCYPVVIPDFTKHSPTAELDQTDIGMGREDQHHVIGTQVFVCRNQVCKEQLHVGFPVNPPPLNSHYRQVAWAVPSNLWTNFRDFTLLLWKEGTEEKMERLDTREHF